MPGTPPARDSHGRRVPHRSKPQRRPPMRFDPRLAIPAAAAEAAMAIPAAAPADTPANRGCPDPSSGYMLEPVLIAPAGASKDNNADGFVCMKVTPGSGDPTKDNNNPISTNPDDYVDDIIF